MDVRRHAVRIGCLVVAILGLGFSAQRISAVQPQVSRADAQDDQDALPQSLRRLMDAYVELQAFSGVVLVAQADEIVFAESYGLANRAHQVPNVIDTRFSIASISKTFVACAVMVLAGEGRLSVHAPISTYLAEFPTTLGSRISIHHLLTHSSGLPREVKFEAWENLSLAEHTARIGGQRLRFEPGSEYSYSNSGFVLLGRVVEVVSGQMYNSFVQERILNVVGLEDTGFLQGRRVVDKLASGYKTGRDGPERTLRSRHLGIYPAGGMYSTVRDLYRYSLALETDSLLSDAGRAALFSEHLETGSGTGLAGYGWQIRKPMGSTILLATGSGDGTKGLLMRDPSRRNSVVMLANTANVAGADLAADVFRLLMGGTYEPPTGIRYPEVDDYALWVGDYDFSGGPLAELLGEDDLIFSLFVEGDKLYMFDPTEDSADVLAEKADGVLGLVFSDELAISFESMDDGAAVMIWHWQGRVFRASRR